jgi:hypothetical protein
MSVEILTLTNAPLIFVFIGTHLATSFGFVPAAFSLSGSGPHRGRHHSESEASDTGLPVGSDILRFQEQWLQLKYSND